MNIKRKKFRDFDSKRLIYEWAETLGGNHEAVAPNNENQTNEKVADIAVDQGREKQLLNGQNDDAKQSADAALLNADATLLKIMDQPGFDKDGVFDKYLDETRKYAVRKDILRAFTSDPPIRDLIVSLLGKEVERKDNELLISPMHLAPGFSTPHTIEDFISVDPVLSLAIDNIPFVNGRFSLNEDYIEGIAKALNIPNDEANTLRHRMSVLFGQIEEKANRNL